jgi:hypothetical protein
VVKAAKEIVIDNALIAEIKKKKARESRMWQWIET